MEIYNLFVFERWAFLGAQRFIACGLIFHTYLLWLTNIDRSGQVYYTTIQVIEEREEGDKKGESVLVRRVTVENARIGLVTIVHH